MAFFKKNVFGQTILLKRFIIRLFGMIVYFRFNWVHKPKITGSEIFRDLPDQNVLIVSNHQTYFADVSFFLHAIYASLAGKPNNIRYPGFLFCKKHNIYYVAAEETMKSGFLPKMLAYSGAVTVNRSWRANGENVRRKVDRKETQKIDTAIQTGWTITFPQGTTSPFAPGRIGTAILIKKHQPVVVPVVINGFRRAFDKKGLRNKKRGTTLSMTVKPPMKINYDDKVEDILSQIMYEIEQDPIYNKVKKLKANSQKM